MVKARPALSVLASALAAALAATPAHAEWRFIPGVDLSETWTDNVGQQPPGQEKSQLVTTVRPGFTISNETPRLKLHADYHLSLYAYGGGRPAGTNGNSQSLTADAKARVLSDLLFLDANANIQQYAASAFGPGLTPGSDYLATNRNEVRSFRVSPYLRHNFGTLANVLVRYTYDNVHSDNAGLGNSSSNTLDASLSSGPTFRKIGWSLGATQQVIDDSVAGTSHITNANLGLRYVMSEQLTLTTGGGYDRYDYDSQGGDTKGASWTAGLQWTPSARTSITASGGHRFYGPSYYLSAQHRSRGSVWNVSYNDAVTTSRSQFTLPSTVSTASLLDQLFSATIPDPALRAAAVRAYLAASGLPTSLPNAVNYFSNRFQLQRSFQATSTMRLARSSALLGIFKTRREAVSNENVDSALFGSQNSLLNDNTDQTGVNASLSFQFGPRTQGTLSASAYKVESLSLGRTDHNRQLSLYLTRQFASKLSGIAEVRHARGSTLATGDQKYTANSVSLGLAMTF
jgi:uncharacterized protein (PEP-CTERM system associated)